MFERFFFGRKCSSDLYVKKREIKEENEIVSFKMKKHIYENLWEKMVISEVISYYHILIFLI